MDFTSPSTKQIIQRRVSVVAMTFLFLLTYAYSEQTEASELFRFRVLQFGHELAFYDTLAGQSWVVGPSSNGSGMESNAPRLNQVTTIIKSDETKSSQVGLSDIVLPIDRTHEHIAFLREQIARIERDIESLSLAESHPTKKRLLDLERHLRTTLDNEMARLQRQIRVIRVVWNKELAKLKMRLGKTHPRIVQLEQYARETLNGLERF